MKPTHTREEWIKMIARSLCSIVVEYDDNGDKDTSAGESRTKRKKTADDNGTTNEVIRNQRLPRNKSEDDGNCSYCSEADPPVVRNRRHTNDTSSSVTKPKPVAVYVGDACTHDRFKGLIMVWLVNDCRGIRVILPPSVSAVEDDDSCDGDLDPSRNTLHMALLDDFGGQRRRRHLYFTYGRHPDAYRIPVTAFRVHGRGDGAGFTDLRLSSCPSTGRSRCVMNVGRKPISGGGSIGRPLVPVDSAYGAQWYFRDPAAIRRGDLYVWDARRTFHPEYFEMVVHGHVTAVASVQHSGCSSVPCSGCCLPPNRRHRRDTEHEKDTGREKDVGREKDADQGKDTEQQGKETGRGKDKGRSKDKGRGKDRGRGKGTRCEQDYGCNDDDDDPCESCNDASDALIKNGTVAGNKRPIGGRLSPGCMEITSVDYENIEPTGTTAGGYVLWALQSNIRDWVNGQTGRFGMTALLCPIVCNTAGD